MGKTNNVPSLRFSSFSGDWSDLKIGICTTKIGSGNTPNGGEKVYTDFGIPFIRSQNVNNNKLILDEISFIPPSINDKMQGSVVKPNDILLNITGASIGRSCVVPDDFLIGNVNQHVCIIRVKPDYSAVFFHLYLSSPKGQKSIRRSQVGSGREGLNFQSIKLLNFHIPSLPEQQKIANFLTSVDTKIQQLSKKKALLEQYKKGVMQKLFNQELRFKDDNGNDYPDWEEKRLGEVAKMFSGGTPLTTKKEYYHGEIPFIKSGEISSKVTQQFITKEGLLNSSAKSVQTGDLLYALYGATSGEVSICKINGAINQAVLCIRSINSHFFLYYYLRLNKENIISTFLQGGQGNLSAVIIKSLLIPLPSIPEQEKIANFLLSVDKKIEMVNDQLSKTQHFKKGLLQQMFV